MIRSLIVLASLALVGLLVIQIYWFKRAFDIEANQFDAKVNIALRSVAHKLLKEKGDSISTIPPIVKTASNTFYLPLKADFTFDELDTKLNNEFTLAQIESHYELSVLNEGQDEVVYGFNFYTAPFNQEVACKGREKTRGIYNISITFPDKVSDLASGLGIWIFTAIIFILVLIYFAYSLFVMLKEKKLSEVRKDFINNKTHELKTPISNISVASEVLKDKYHKLSAEKSIHYANIIYKENQRLKKQIDRVLEMAVLENGEIDLKCEPFDLNLLMQEIVEDQRMIIESRKGSLLYEEIKGNSIITADKFHLSNVIFTLIDNAVKYSLGTPKIVISAQNTIDNTLITVKDNGLGIKKEYQKQIFDKFFKVPSGDVHNVKGFGLGLSYVKMIVEAHGGQVTVESIDNSGSTFSVSI
ncbi:MAG TPA: HAMP domain-containing sensor histidine kinase [Cytophagaceae bacterium]